MNYHNSRASRFTYSALRLALVSYLITFCLLRWSANDQTGSGSKAEQRRSGQAEMSQAPATSGFKIHDPTNPSIETCLDTYDKDSKYSKLIDCVNDFNRQTPIRLQEKFLVPSDQAEFPPRFIVILVHDRHDYFAELLKSLKNAANIEHITLILSHDGYYPEIEKTIRYHLDFCRYIQIYHPFSKDLIKDKARIPNSIRINNGRIPSVFVMDEGSMNTRVSYVLTNATESFIADPRFKQTAPKHHYWWIWHTVFEADSFLAHRKITPSSPSEMDVLFLEEDHLPSHDIVIQWDKLLLVREQRCPDCFSVNLGRHRESGDVYKDWFRASVSVTANIGLGFNRKAFQSLHKEAEFYCGYNEYNWDVTIGRMSQMDKIKEKSVTSVISRVKHIGYVHHERFYRLLLCRLCGMHIKSDQCDSKSVVDDFRKRDVDFELLLLEERERKEPPRIAYDDHTWLEASQKTRPQLGPFEGWINGRMWDANGAQNEVWTSDVHKDHCLAVSQGLGWKIE